jgi:hypothetical protein
MSPAVSGLQMSNSVSGRYGRLGQAKDYFMLEGKLLQMPDQKSWEFKKETS